tara:strand:- start:498 stop:998 length:501 start_codon:yes stop_codon:yes gene_type:complete
MKKNAQPIAVITKTSGYSGEVRLKPLSRYCDDYLDSNNLEIGMSIDVLNNIELESIIGEGKNRRFKFKNINNLNEAKNLIGKILHVKVNQKDKINLISSDVLGFEVIDNNGLSVGVIDNILWLPNNDIYVIKKLKKEILIPIVEEFIKSIDYNLKIVQIKIIEGMV